MIWDKILDALDEPSTYAGLAPIALGLGIAEEEFQAISLVLAAIFGAVAVFKREKTNKS